jgi:hypothetical protein
VTGTLPSGAQLLVDNQCSGCDTIGTGGTLNVTGGELKFVNNGELEVLGTFGVTDGSMFPVPSGARLKFRPGSTFKADDKSGIDVESGALLEVAGSEGAAVTFTSEYDSVGGNVITGESRAPAAGDWAGIKIESASSLELEYADFRYADAALDVAYLDSMEVIRSDFALDKSAIKVAGTADNDPVLGALPCLPPYLSFIQAREDWFGPIGPDVTGLPSPSIDLASVIGFKIPDALASLFGAGATLAGDTYTSFGSYDSVPWSIYSCPALAEIPIPVTPVVVSATPAQPWFPDPETQN